MTVAGRGLGFVVVDAYEAPAKQSASALTG
jgi:hypothetical protein